MVAFGVPRSVASSAQGLEFIDATCGALLESLKLQLHNRSRQRTRLEGLLQDLAIVQENAALLDTHFREAHGLDEGSPRHLLQWALDETLRAMQHYIVLGLELELFMDEEVAAALWYLECLLKYRINVIGHMQNLKRDMHHMRLRVLQEEEDAAEEEKRRGSPSGGSGRSNKKKGKGGAKDKAKGRAKDQQQQASAAEREEQQQLPDDSELREDTVELNVLCLLCRGSHHFITGMLRAQGGAGVPPQPKFCSWEERSETGAHHHCCWSSPDEGGPDECVL